MKGSWTKGSRTRGGKGGHKLSELFGHQDTCAFRAIRRERGKDLGSRLGSMPAEGKVRR